MPLNFPNSPTNGNTYTYGGVTYTYNGNTSPGYWEVLTPGNVQQATGAEITAGTDNLKYATAKALEDSDYWNARNDGAGSGLDADLLDGKQLTSIMQFANVATVSGAVKWVKLGSTSGGVASRLMMFLTTGGTNGYGAATNYTSGVATLSATIGNASVADNLNLIYTEGANGTKAITDVKVVELTSTTHEIWVKANTFTNIQVAWVGTIAFTPNGTQQDADPGGFVIPVVKEWNSSNDGANSGLDADLLDGQHASYFAAKGAGDSFPAGTKMLFMQASAPVGWTKDTTHNNKALRIVSGTGGGSGGSLDFTTAFASRSVSGSIANKTATGSITVNNHTLTLSQIPSHNHSGTYAYFRPSGIGSDSYRLHAFKGSSGSATYNMASAGGGGAHNHGGSFSGVAHNHTFTGTAINMATKYVDSIICTKD